MAMLDLYGRAETGSELDDVSAMISDVLLGTLEWHLERAATRVRPVAD